MRAVPNQGDILIWFDGRKFLFTEADFDVIGFWWKANSLDGSSKLAGNFTLQQVGTRTWKPANLQRSLS